MPPTCSGRSKGDGKGVDASTKERPAGRQDQGGAKQPGRPPPKRQGRGDKTQPTPQDEQPAGKRKSGSPQQTIGSPNSKRSAGAGYSGVQCEQNPGQPSGRPNVKHIDGHPNQKEVTPKRNQPSHKNQDKKPPRHPSVTARRRHTNMRNPNKNNQNERTNNKTCGIDQNGNPQSGNRKQPGSKEPSNAEASTTNHPNHSKGMILLPLPNNIRDQSKERTVKELLPSRKKTNRRGNGDNPTGTDEQQGAKRLQNLRDNHHGSRPNPIDKPPGNRRHKHPNQGANGDGHPGHYQRQPNNPSRVDEREWQKEPRPKVVNPKRHKQRTHAPDCATPRPPRSTQFQARPQDRAHRSNTRSSATPQLSMVDRKNPDTGHRDPVDQRFCDSAGALSARPQASGPGFQPTACPRQTCPFKINNSRVIHNRPSYPQARSTTPSPTPPTGRLARRDAPGTGWGFSMYWAAFRRNLLAKLLWCNGSICAVRGKCWSPSG